MRIAIDRPNRIVTHRRLIAHWSHNAVKSIHFTNKEVNMSSENGSTTHDHKGRKGTRDCGMFGGVYGLAFIGAAVYFIGHAATFWGGVLGFLKAVVWPAVVMYRALELMGM
jgi:hypothetical protein